MKAIKSLFLIALSLAIVCFVVKVSHQEYVGINVGNWAKYSVSAEWSSEDPNATISAYWRDLKNTEWETVKVQAIAGTNITILVTSGFADDTERDAVYWGDVTNTQGKDEFGFQIVSAGLGQGDIVRQSLISINYTLSKEFAGKNRKVNYAGYTIRAEGVTTYEFYWDKETGMLCALLLTDRYSSGGYMTRSGLQKKIVETNIWQPQASYQQPLLQWAPPIIVATIFVTALLLIRRNRKAKPRRRRN